LRFFATASDLAVLPPGGADPSPGPDRPRTVPVTRRHFLAVPHPKEKATMKRTSTNGKSPLTLLSRREALRLFGGTMLAIPMTGYLGGGLWAGADPSKIQADNLALRFAKYYQPVRVTARPQVPAYKLPLDADQIANFEVVAGKLGLARDEASLKENGFAVLPGKSGEDVVEPYKDLKRREIPVFVTADTLLHLYHVQFDETLKDIEEREFYKDVVALTEALLARLVRMARYFDCPPEQGVPPELAMPVDEDFRAAHKKAMTYFAIGLKALKPDAKLPELVAAKDVDEVLEQMKQHAGFWPEPDAAHQQWPLFRYAEDFSQYVPRGHYTRSETLKRYFVGMMWFGRMAFLLKGHRIHGPQDEPALVSPQEADRQTLAAALITKMLRQVRLADGRRGRDVWERIYAVTAFYVGLADDLGAEQYHEVLAKVCGAALDLAVLADAKKLLTFKAELSKLSPPAIYSGTGGQSTVIADGPVADQVGPEKLVEALGKSQGFRFFGQRFIPDSHMMGQLVFPTVGDGLRPEAFTCVVVQGKPIRGFPRGLDVMTLLGSGRARELLRELGDDAYRGGGQGLGYAESLAKLAKEYGQLGDRDWNRNLYWSWLHALKPLLADFGPGYPTFMTTRAYRTKSLNSALASWAQLRHDTILYAKQSYTMGLEVVSFPHQPKPPLKPVEGYVEPIPEFYARLLALARMTNRGLSEMNVLDAAARGRLNALEKLLERLLAVSEKELANQELQEADYEFIRNFGENLEGVIVKPDPGLKFGESPAMKTTLVADVHTDQNSKQVLEEGTGYVDLGVFVYKQPDGRLVLGAGPVLSYYEFKHPMGDRLTDEKWREMLKGDKAPARPEWSKLYLATRGAY
jgi:hypothetical protein